MELVLSLFPGIDLLGRGFSAEGFSVVKGPDLLWDERIEEFHVPSHRFDGIIGGPPCQNFSDANRRRDTDEGDRLLREFLRIVTEAQPEWWLMENVRNVPDVALEGYLVQRLDITDAECGGKQRRLFVRDHPASDTPREGTAPPGWSQPLPSRDAVPHPLPPPEAVPPDGRMAD